MRFASAAAEQTFERLRASLCTCVVAFDFDGTLSPIVADPTQAFIHPDAPDALAALGPQVAALAVITGRPVATVLGLGGLDELGRRLLAQGCDLSVFGHYGNERWSASVPEIRTPPPPGGLAALRQRLPDVLAEADAGDAFVEDKGLAIAVHTRRMPDAAGAFARLSPLVHDLAAIHGLQLEPGRFVLEVRAPGVDKGAVVRELIAQVGATGCLYAGDDLGDLPAYDALDAAQADGLLSCRVAVASAEQSVVAQRADVVVDDSAGLVELLRRFSPSASL